MPQVPYTPYPTAAPTEQGTPRVNINAIGEAFGTNVAEALGHLGQVTEKAGNELYNRAYAMQQLNNETDAKNADIDFMSKAGDLHARYNELQGQDRVKAFPKYSADLKDLYQKTRGTLGNPMAQRMFDSTAVSTMSRSIFNGAGAAATAGRESALSAADAEYKLTTQQVYNSPDDESSFRDAIERNHASAATRAALSTGGWSQEKEDLIKKTGDSELAYHRLDGMAATQPLKASELFNKYKAEGLIWGQQAETITNRIRTFSHSSGMEPVANDVLNSHRQADGTFDKTFEQMQQEARDKAAKLYPDDPGIGAAAAGVFDKNYNQIQWAKTRDRQDVDQQVAGFITKGVSNPALLPPELRQRMTDKQIKDFPVQANYYQHAVNKQTDDAISEKLLGLYNNDNGKFMDTNIMTTKGLSRSSMDYFLKLQRQAQASGDPRVARAVKWIQGAHASALAELGIYSRTKDNTDDYDRFTGAIHEAIQAYQETYQKPPGEKEITQEIYPAIISKITQPGFFNIGGYGTTKEVPFFNAPVPDGVKAAAEKDAGHELSDLEVRQIYNRLQYKQLFEGKKASSPKDQSKVPNKVTVY